MEKPRRNQWATTGGYWNQTHQDLLDGVTLDFKSAEGDMTPGVVRTTRTALIQPNDSSGPLFQLLQDVIGYHNEEFYGFTLLYIQALQLHEYCVGDQYSQHHDWGGVIDAKRQNLCRKLSFSIQLSDPADYEGGDLEFYYGEPWCDEYRQKIRAKGTLITWPGFVLHGVTPVTRGVRRSLVGFCVGPDFT
jgi:PKHD-type hydroxylase